MILSMIMMLIVDFLILIIILIICLLKLSFYGLVYEYNDNYSFHYIFFSFYNFFIMIISVGIYLLGLF